MHQIVLITALTATSGLFGGGRHGCSSGRCGGQSYAPATCSAQAPCSAPRYAPQYAPAQAPAAVAPAPQAAYYHSNYYYAPTAASCPTGNCPRR